jgi:regulatory protein
MARPNRPRPALDRAALERFALRYVERYATTRVRLSAYLARKIRERGWDGDGPEDAIAAIAERFAELGYVDDRGFAEARAAALTRRGLGARRVEQALRHAGIDETDRQEIGADLLEQDAASALAFARRRRIGPFGAAITDRAQRERQVAAMIRAGHAPGIAWKIASMAPGDEPYEEFGHLSRDG